MDKNLTEHILITVLLPVYNSEKYLKEAIDSILAQTYHHFEFLIINDGSTDKSLEIIQTYSDKRIVLINNDGNKGLIYTLNKGIDLAKGTYIARMDNDDIAMPDRFQIQLDYFNNFPDASVICSLVLGISENGKPSKNWDVDWNTQTEEQIKNSLSKENCIAHPSVLIKTDVAKKYKYNVSQKGSEDWDLWMRLASDNHRIIKTKEPLLKYRYLSTGITLTDKKKQPVEIKVLKVKAKFLFQQLLKFKVSIFEVTTFYSILRTIGRHIKLNVLQEPLRSFKRIITINPLKVYQQYRSLKRFCETANQIDIFFFFPYCHIGGAEKVHANIVEVFKDKKVAVFFTGISKQNGFLYLFKKLAPSFNVGFCLNHPFYSNRSNKLIVDLINAQKSTTIFGCNNMFFYNAILKLKNNVRIFDLMHDFRFEGEENVTHQFSQQFFRCQKRIFISSKAIEQTKLFYDSIAAPPEEYNKLELITNYVNIPEIIPQKDYYSNMRVLYVGRDTEEKRAFLFAKVAERCKKSIKSMEFVAIGELEKVIPLQYQNYVILTGSLGEYDKLVEYYKTFHVIVITSAREGFPMVIMEGMANGMTPISTPVGDVPKHIDLQNGFVTNNLMDTEKVVEEMVNYLLELNSNRELLKQKSINSFAYAKKYFSKQLFYDSYERIIAID